MTLLVLVELSGCPQRPFLPIVREKVSHSTVLHIRMTEATAAISFKVSLPRGNFTQWSLSWRPLFPVFRIQGFPFRPARTVFIKNRSSGYWLLPQMLYTRWGRSFEDDVKTGNMLQSVNWISGFKGNRRIWIVASHRNLPHSSEKANDYNNKSK